MSSTTSTAIVPRPAQPVQPVASTSGTAAATRPTQRPLPRNGATRQQRAAPSPGRFQHPRMTEIAKRRAATSFTAQNIQIILLNAALIMASFIGRRTVHPVLTKVIETISLDQLPVAIDASRILLLLRLILLANVLLALRPVLPYFNKPDQLDDIDLTPSQRALLGLPPSQSNTPKTPVYVTPPRYMRSSPLLSTSQANQSIDRRSISVNYTPQSTPRFSPGTWQQPQQPSATPRFSPAASQQQQQPQQQGSPTPSRRPSGSLFESSPLYYKFMTNLTSQNNAAPQADFTESTRSLLAGRESTGSISGGSLRRSSSMREPGTPTPSSNTKERTKVKLDSGLNYKWLYEKGLKVGKNGGFEY